MPLMSQVRDEDSGEKSPSVPMRALYVLCVCVCVCVCVVRNLVCASCVAASHSYTRTTLLSFFPRYLPSSTTFLRALPTCRAPPSPSTMRAYPCGQLIHRTSCPVCGSRAAARQGGTRTPHPRARARARARARTAPAVYTASPRAASTTLRGSAPVGRPTMTCGERS
jgi:hypothetical protein